MESKSPESGFEELIRLSKETGKIEEAFARKEQELAKREQERAEKKQTIRGLSELKVSVALEQLKPVATPEIIEKVSSLSNMQDTGALRILISDLATELETGIHSKTGSNPDMLIIERSVKTLAILIELLFSLE